MAKRSASAKASEVRERSRPNHALAMFKRLVEIMEEPGEKARKGYYQALLHQAIGEIGATEGSLVLAEKGPEGMVLRLAAVKGLASEIWAGDRPGLGRGPVAEAAQSLNVVRGRETFGEQLCVPLLYRAELQGVLVLNRPEGQDFGAGEFDESEWAAEGLAAAIWASRTLELKSEAEQHLAALIAAGSSFILGRNLKDVLNRIIQEAQSLMEAEAASVFLLEEESGELLSPVATGPFGEELKQYRLAKGEGIAGWVVEHGEAQLVRQAVEDQRFASRIDKKTRFKTRDMICVPMRADGRILGVLEVLNKRAPKQFQEREIPVLQALANLAAVAVESARLYDHMAEQAQRLNQDLTLSNAEGVEIKNRLESVLFAMEDGVIAADENGRVTLTNRAAQIIAFGLSYQDPLGRLLGEVIPRPAFHEKLSEVRLSGENAVLELDLATPDERSFAVVITPIKDLEGYLTGFVIVLRDVTRFKELERMKVAFLNTVSHELRTPMTSIRAFSELMIKRQTDPSKMTEWAAVIFDEAQRLGRLIDDLLDVSRIEAGKKLSVNRRLLALAPLFEKSQRLFEKDREKHPIHVSIDEGLDTAELDPDRMEQILANLLSNAIKYSPDGGPIELRARFKEPDRLRIEVQDHGLGFGSAEKAQLFQKFYRVENKEHVSIRGTGLGLSITKYLVEQHEGEIGADSVPGEGSCFWLEIPIFASKGGE